jgi:hypothetical protein
MPACQTAAAFHHLFASIIQSFTQAFKQASKQFKGTQHLFYLLFPRSETREIETEQLPRLSLSLPTNSIIPHKFNEK